MTEINIATWKGSKYAEDNDPVRIEAVLSEATFYVVRELIDRGIGDMLREIEAVRALAQHAQSETLLPPLDAGDFREAVARREAALKTARAAVRPLFDLRCEAAA